MTKTIRPFALLENAFNATYYTYDTFAPISRCGSVGADQSVPIVQVPNATDTRSYNIAAILPALSPPSPV